MLHNVSRTLVGFPRTDPSPLCSASAPLWSTYRTEADAHFLNGFTSAKTPAKWKKLTSWWPEHTAPPTPYHLLVPKDHLTPCDTALFPPHQPIRELCESGPLNLPLKALCWDPLESSGFLSTGCSRLLVWCLMKWMLHFPSPQPGGSWLEVGFSAGRPDDPSWVWW